MPIGRWNLKSEDPSIRHMGPMAQQRELTELKVRLAALEAALQKTGD